MQHSATHFITRVALACVLSIAAAGCSTGHKGAIQGTIEGAQGKTIYLERFVNNRMVIADSAVIGTDGGFLLVPSKALELNYYRIVIDRSNALALITDSTESACVKATLGEFDKTATVSGSVHSEELRELETKCAPFDKKDEEARERMGQQDVSPEERQMLNQSLTDNRREMVQCIKDWLVTHESSPAALIAVQRLDPRTDMATFNKIFANLKGIFGHTLIYKAMTQELAKFSTPNKQQGPEISSALAIGQQAPEIALNDPQGKLRKLSDLRGKTVLIDFWASWCGPCRRENPNVVVAYNKYNKDGFEVFSVSLDKAKEPWLEAIQQDGLIWPNHVSDLKWWDSEAAKTYDVHSIPFTVLVDKEGKILGHNLRGPMLEEKLRAIYGR